MGVAFRRGSTTGTNDLTISCRDGLNNPIDPYRIEYAVYDYTTGLEVLIGSPVNIPVRISLGNFYAPVTIPADGNIGSWRIRWTIQEKVTDPVYQSVEEFAVIGDAMIASFTGNLGIDQLIHSLRILLRDNNPDRNYRFRPPASEKFIQGQTQVFGFLWEDEELYEHLIMAIDDFNSRPPTTGIDLNNITSSERRWRTTVLLRAAAFACFGITMNWILDEFSVDGEERIVVQDEEGNEYSLTMMELFDLMYGDRLKEITDQMKKEVVESMKEVENEVQ